MKQEYNKKKKATIIALSAVALCLAAGLFWYMGTLNHNEPPALPVDTQPPTQSEIVVPEIKPDSNSASNSEQGTPSVDGDVQDKPSDDKPKTPEEATPPSEKPNAGNSSDSTNHDTTNPETNNPSKPPEYKPEQTKPNETPDTPQSGDKNSNGAIYVPGFGWVEDSGEENTTVPGDFEITGEKVGDM